MVTRELNVGSQSVADASSHLAGAAAQASNLILEIDENIEEISKQTNILALNALVEAARAGDADEISIPQSVEVSEEEMISENQGLITLKNTDNTVNYQTILKKKKIEAKK